MMRCLLFMLLTTGLALTSIVSATQLPNVSGEVDRRVWDGQPIAVDLQVDKERRLIFPVPVHLDIDPRLVPVLRTQIIDGHVYLRASAPFEKTRVIAGSLDGKSHFLVDLQASPSPVPDHPIAIAVPSANPLGAAGSSDPATNQAKSTPVAPPGYVSLVRWMARELYAPDRLRQPAPGVARITIDHAAVPLYRGSAVEATPIVAWRGQSRYLTAVKLRNLAPVSTTLDPRALRGRWLTRTLHHARLGPSGSETDITVAYLISKASFSESLQ